MLHAGQLAQSGEDLVRGLLRLEPEMALVVGLAVADAGQDFLLRLLAETVQSSHVVFLAGRAQLGDRIDPQFFLQGSNFLRTQAGDGEHLDQARRHGGLELFEEFQPPGRVQFGDLLREGLADAFNLLQSAGLDPLRKIGLAERLDHARSRLVGADFEGILALQLEQQPDFSQHSSDFSLVHGSRLTTGGTENTEYFHRGNR
jgi:hypothetical protein